MTTVECWRFSRTSILSPEPEPRSPTLTAESVAKVAGPPITNWNSDFLTGASGSFRAPFASAIEHRTTGKCGPLPVSVTTRFGFGPRLIPLKERETMRNDGHY
jgi:hypothetical protein